MEKENLDYKSANNLINKKSGMLGITGVSPDMREIREAAEEGNDRAKMGLDMYAYRVKKYIGSYVAAMNGIDIIVFTGGIGENDWETRADILKNMDYLGVKFDEAGNENVKAEQKIITKPDSKVISMIVPTNEELVIASDTESIVKNTNN